MIDPNEVRLESMRQYGFGTEAMKELKVCGSCGAMCPAEKTHCSECHAKLPKDTLYQAYKRRHTSCPGCETIVPDTVHFCPQCGSRVQ